MTSKRLIVIVMVFLCSQVSCSGDQRIEPIPPATTARVRPSEPEPQKFSDDVLWQMLVDNPGQAGIDFKADEVLVVFSQHPQARTIAELSESAGEGNLASQMPNELLRENTEYEAITQEIADTLDLVIRQQVYIDDLNLASFRVPEDMDAAITLQKIRTDFSGQVDWAIHNPLRRAAYTPNDPDFNTGSFGRQWGHWKIGCRGAWDHTMGDPSVWIAVVDTGVRISHEELSGQVLIPASQFPGSNLDVVNGDNNVEDNDGHGTFISGIAVAAGDNNRTIVGVAPGCRVMPVKISNDGWATSADIITGCLLAHNLGAKVINLSFGDDSQVPAEESMVNQIWSGGGVFVGSAGNEGMFNASYPAAYTNSLCVGSTDYWDDCSVFSNWGSALDIAAPGQELKSCGFTTNSSYEYDGMGTSYSAPMVAAGAALLWSFEPTLTNAEVRSTLLNNAGVAWYFSVPLPRLNVSSAVLSLIVPEIPSITGVFPPADTVFGSVISSNILAVSVTGPQDVAEVTYTLDVQPLGQFGPDDPTITVSSGASFYGTLPVPATLPNQQARLVVELVSSTGHSGETSAVPLVIFNQLGDINQDGLVDQQDVDDLPDYLGTNSGSPDFSLFADGSQDGSVNEADLALIGYNWGAGAVAPDIVLVSPLEGTASEEITFLVAVAGTEPLTYEWDFAGATEPATSSDETPQVLLVSEGTHEFSVTVSNIAGSDYFPFQFEMAPAPVTVIDSVNPTEGHLGEIVDFNIEWSVFEPSEFSWDFSSAGIPGTSTESAPIVELSSEGVFFCSVYAGNGGIGDTFEFELTVNPTPPPVAVIRANPQMGQPPLFVEFDASDSYSPAHSIVQYEWSWDGDEVWESTTSEPLESHTFNDLQTYTVRLKVTDEIARTAQTTKEISVRERNVYDNWASTTLGTWGHIGTLSTQESAATNITGRPAIAWIYDESGEETSAHIAMADISQPQDIDDWNSAVLKDKWVGTGTISITELDGEAAFAYEYLWKIMFGKYNGSTITEHVALDGETGNIDDGVMGVIGGKPAFFFRAWSASIFGNAYLYANATVSNPQSQGDWHLHEPSNIKIQTHHGTANQLKEINGLPMLLGEWNEDYYFQIVNFASSTTPLPDDWSNCSIGNENFNDQAFLLVNHEEKPAVIANNRNGAVYNIKYAYANSATPVDPTDWTLYEPNPGADGWLITGGLVGGNPAYCYQQSDDLYILVIAQTPTPIIPADWIVYELENLPYVFLGVVDHGGLPGIFGVNYSHDLLYMYPIP